VLEDDDDEPELDDLSMAEAELTNKSVRELKLLCDARNLPSSGKKADLVARLLEAPK